MFRLCLALGVVHPDRLGDMLTSQEFSEWIAYYNTEPFGPQVDDLRAGVVAATVANVARAKGSKAMKPQDFFASLQEDKTDQRMTISETIQAFARATGTTVPDHIAERQE